MAARRGTAPGLGSPIAGLLDLLARRRLRQQPRRPRGPRLPPLRPPLEQISADLTRLAADLDHIERSDLPAKIARMRASGLAYDLVLIDACRALDVPLPGDAPLTPGGRLTAELELARAGLRW